MIYEVRFYLWSSWSACWANAGRSDWSTLRWPGRTIPARCGPTFWRRCWPSPGPRRNNYSGLGADRTDHDAVKGHRDTTVNNKSGCCTRWRPGYVFRRCGGALNRWRSAVRRQQLRWTSSSSRRRPYAVIVARGHGGSAVSTGSSTKRTAEKKKNETILKKAMDNDAHNDTMRSARGKRRFE